MMATNPLSFKSQMVSSKAVLAPVLFGLMFTALLTDAFSENDPGIDIRYRKDGGVFNLQRLRAKTKVHIESPRDFLFADNFALNASTEADIQISLNNFRMHVTTLVWQ